MAKTVWIERQGAITLRRATRSTLMERLSSWRAGDEQALLHLTRAARDGLARFARAHAPSDRSCGIPRAVVRHAVSNLLGSGAATQASMRFAAAQLLRRVLVEQPAYIARHTRDICSFDRALNQLRRRDALSADIIELHYFAGQLPVEIAQTLDAPAPLVLDKLRFCKAWLAAEMRRLS